jgi:hypothetical protein
MNQSSLEQRRGWFRFFPEGSLEFVVVTRVLTMLLILLSMVVTGNQRTIILIGLFGMLWIDHLLTLSWTVQLATDLKGLLATPPAGSAELTTARRRALLLMVLPMSFVLAAVAPWPELLLPAGAVRHTAARLVPIVMGIGFVVSMVPAFRQARALTLGPSLWTGLLLVPLLHWVGIHRLLSHLDRKISSGFRSQPPQENSGPATLAAAADLLWGINILPWLLLLVLALGQRGAASETLAYRVFSICGTLLFGLYSVVDLGAMERVQKRFVQLIRSL